MVYLNGYSLRKAFLPEGATRFLKQLGMRLSGLGFMVSGLLLAMALASYRPEDPSWNTATNAPTTNVFGAVGAIIADLFLQTLGFAAVLPVLCLVIWGARFIMTAQRIPSLWLRLLTTPVAALLLAIGLAILPRPWFWPFVARPGGFVGELLLDRVSDLLRVIGFSYNGIWIVAIPFTIIGLIIFLFILGIAWSEWQTALRLMADASLLIGRARTLLRLGAGEALRVCRASLSSFAIMSGAKIVIRGDRSPMINRVKIGDGTNTLPGSQWEDKLYEPGESYVSAVEGGERGQLMRTVVEGISANAAYQAPPIKLLALPEPVTGQVTRLSEEGLVQNSRVLEAVLSDFSVQGQIVKIRPGPVVTLYELEPAPGTKTSRVIGLADDIARSMSALAVRIAVVPGQNVIGIELPNTRRETVYLHELLAAEGFDSGADKLVLALGKDIGGTPVYVDLARMPHLLIAGTTGSGKSVAINTMILSLLYRLEPTDCRLVMIDPKMLELSVYDGIPHLLAPVVTDPAKAVLALKWTVREMENRYRAMSQLGVRNIAGYNQRIEEARVAGQTLNRTVQTGFDPDSGKPVYEEQTLALDQLPFIVVVVDEMADLMLVAGKEVEGTIQRLAQMARAAGIHLIMATQRPSVDVITGTIKANFPTRISFQVTSKIDSRTILGEQGAEQLLGQGDMLYMAAGGRITRVHGPFVTDGEVEQVVKYLWTQGTPAYVTAVTEEENDLPAGAIGANGGDRNGEDNFYNQAVAVVLRERKCSTSFIQRQLQIGYNRAARIVERMETEALISRPNHIGKREVLGRG